MSRTSPSHVSDPPVPELEFLGKLANATSRRTFLQWAGLSIGVAAMAGCNSDDDNGTTTTGGANLGSGDTGILNYAYALEQLEAAFYIKVVATPYSGMSGAETTLLTDIRDHEVTHRDFLKAALGGSAIAGLSVDFSSINFGDRTSVLTAAKTFEDLGVSAYNGAGKLFSTTATGTAYLGLAGKIVSVEARHAAAIRDLLSPLSASFAGDDVVDANGLDVKNTSRNGAQRLERREVCHHQDHLQQPAERRHPVSNVSKTILGSIDPEIAERLVTRRGAVADFSKKVGVAAIASAPVMLGVMARSAFGEVRGVPQSIIDVLNFALTLEYLESSFYNAGLAAPGAIAAANRTVFTQIAKHENAHVAFLKGQLGSAAVASPTFDFTAGGTFADVLTNPATFLAVSQAFEDTGVRAYKGQAGNLQSDPATLTAALQIHSVEARHASEVRRIRGQKGWITGAQTDIAAAQANYAGEDNVTQAGVNVGAFVSVNAGTEAFDEPLTKEQVLALVTPFIVSM